MNSPYFEVVDCLGVIQDTRNRYGIVETIKFYTSGRQAVRILCTSTSETGTKTHSMILDDDSAYRLLGVLESYFSNKEIK